MVRSLIFAASIDKSASGHLIPFVAKRLAEPVSWIKTRLAGSRDPGQSGRDPRGCCTLTAGSASKRSQQPKRLVIQNATATDATEEDRSAPKPTKGKNGTFPRSKQARKNQTPRRRRGEKTRAKASTDRPVAETGGKTQSKKKQKPALETLPVWIVRWKPVASEK